MHSHLKYTAIGIATLLVISGVCFILLSVQDLRGAAELIDSLYAKRVVGLSVQGDLQFGTQESRRRFLYILTTNDYEAKLRHIAFTRQADLQVDLLAGRSIMLGLGPDAAHDLREFADRWVKYCEARDDVIALSLQGRNSGALKREATASLLFDKAELSIRKVKTDIESTAAQEIADNKHRFRRAAFELSALLLLVSVGLVWLLVQARHSRRLQARAERERDVIDQQNQRIEELLRAANQASHAKSEFMAKMSHEIRTPLNGIVGMTDLLDGAHIEGVQKSYLDIIRLSSKHLLQVINGVLDFSRIEAGRLELHTEEVCLPDLFHSVLRTFTAHAAAKGLDLLWDAPPASFPRVVADSARVEQILINLLGNAAKFTAAGEIELRLECRSEPRIGETVEVYGAVRDTGVGIPPDKLGVIFQPFAQADNSLTREYGGTGLGLNIAAHLAEAMGGRVWAESTLGEGSTFHFTLRLPVAGVPPEPSQLTYAGEPVVLVDSGLQSRRIHTAWLERIGFTVHACADASQAPSLLARLVDAEGRLPLVVWNEPCIAADETAQQEALSWRHGWPGCRLVVIERPGGTPHTAPEELDPMLERVSKPVSPDALAAAIARVRGADESLQGLLSATQRTPSEPEPLEIALAKHAESLRVLVAEDNLINQRVLIELLKRLGHAAVVVSNGQEALDRLSVEGFDVVLMDVQMPVLDGYAATVELRRRERGSLTHTPVVALTAHAFSSDRKKASSIGMDGFLTKPIDIAELSRTLQLFAVASPCS